MGWNKFVNSMKRFGKNTGRFIGKAAHSVGKVGNWIGRGLNTAGRFLRYIPHPYAQIAALGAKTVGDVSNQFAEGAEYVSNVAKGNVKPTQAQLKGAFAQAQGLAKGNKRLMLQDGKDGKRLAIANTVQPTV